MADVPLRHQANALLKEHYGRPLRRGIRDAFAAEQVPRPLPSLPLPSEPVPRRRARTKRRVPAMFAALRRQGA